MNTNAWDILAIMNKKHGCIHHSTTSYIYQYIIQNTVPGTWYTGSWYLVYRYLVPAWWQLLVWWYVERGTFNVVPGILYRYLVYCTSYGVGRRKKKKEEKRDVDFFVVVASSSSSSSSRRRQQQNFVSFLSIFFAQRTKKQGAVGRAVFFPFFFLTILFFSCCCWCCLFFLPFLSFSPSLRRRRAMRCAACCYLLPTFPYHMACKAAVQINDRGNATARRVQPSLSFTTSVFNCFLSLPQYFNNG